MFLKFLAPPKVNVKQFQSELDSVFPGQPVAVSAFFEIDGTVLVVEGPDDLDFSGVESLIKGLSVSKTDQEETAETLPALTLEQRIEALENRIAALEGGKP